MAELTRDFLSDTKRRIVKRLKRVDTMTAQEIASDFGLTDTAIRQHLDALEDIGLVTRSVGAPTGRGRPPVRWRLSPLATAFFPDRHGELTVELLDSIRDTFGEKGLEAVLASRTTRQRDTYRRVIGPVDDTTVEVRVRRLAEIRTVEGYLADVQSDGDAFVLTEHHCPVSDTAAACQGLCRGELELFKSLLAETATVERTSHLIAGDARCAYRITPVDEGAPP